MPRGLDVLILAALVALAAAGGSGAASAQVSDEEAFQLFQRLGCIGCHNGNVASAWDEVLAKLREVPEKYGGSLNEFAKNVEYTLDPNVKFNTWDDLKRRMAQNVGRDVNDPDIQRIFSYLESVALGAPREQPGTGQTTTEAPTTTPTGTTETPEETATTPAAGEPGGAAEGGVPLGLAAAIAAVILVVIAVAVYMLSRK